MTDGWNRVDTGAPDAALLARVRTIAKNYDPLVAATEFDNPLNPEAVHLYLDDGIATGSGRFDVTWTDKGYYRYHYTEAEKFNYRYDCHPREELTDAHFHKPPTAAHDEAVPSCIQVSTVRLVTLAVLQLWRDAAENGDLSQLQQPNPP